MKVWGLLHLVGVGLLMLAPQLLRADVVVGINGERFVGEVIEESADAIVFYSQLGGRITIPRGQIREIERTPRVHPGPTTSASLPATVPFDLSWSPPGVGTDGYDWIELKSGEWLKGHIKYVQDKQVQFDSRELERQDFELKDIKRICPANPMYVQFEGGQPEYGRVELNGDVVTLDSAFPVQLPRDQLTGITPGGKSERDYWSGELSLGINYQSGNTNQTQASLTGLLERRTPATTFLMSYRGDFSEVDGSTNTNNQRFTVSDDIYLGKGFFVRAIQLDYYRDPIANIENQLSVLVGGGYKVFDRDDLEWRVGAGPAYQKTWFVDVPEGDDSTSSAPAAALWSYFKLKITRRLDLILNYQGLFTTPEAGLYNQHAVSTLKFKIKNHIDLNLSFVWDRIESPQAESDGTVPNQDSLRFTVGAGFRF